METLEFFSSRRLRKTLSRTSRFLKRTMMVGGARCRDCVEEDADAEDRGTDSALLSWPRCKFPTGRQNQDRSRLSTNHRRR